jgi:hypothetical protein
MATCAATLAMILGGIGLAAAPVATAADLGSVTASCDLSSQTLDIEGAQGDTITVVSGGPYNCNLTSSTPGVVTWVSNDSVNPGQDPPYVFGWTDYSNYPTSGPPTVITITLAQVGTTTWVAQQGYGLTLNITVTPGAVWKPIPPWVQGYARATAADTCQDGWSPSWELWPNGGVGGWVCTREVPSLG